MGRRYKVWVHVEEIDEEGTVHNWRRGKRLAFS